MRILGISCFHRDAAAALVVDGRPVAAYQEERFTRKRLDPAFPQRAVRACLGHAGLTSADLDRVVFYEKPLRKFERLLVTQLAAFPRSARSFSRSMFLWLGDRLWMKNRLSDELGVDAGRIAFTEHQRAHAAAAFFGSPFDAAAVLTVDDFGEWATTALARGSGRELEVLSEVHFPHSLGLFASAISQFLGFEPGSDEHEVEALAAHGTPRFEQVLGDLVQTGEGGSFTVRQDVFRFAHDTERLFGPELEELLGPPRRPGAELRHAGDDARHADVAASLQAVLERTVLELARELHRRAPSERLCFAGQLARNRRLCARLLADGPFDELYVPTACDEAGAALGAALGLAFELDETAVRAGDALGRLGRDDDLLAEPEEGARAVDDPADEVARRLADGARVAWVRGGLELGRESLGGRLLLGLAAGASARTDFLAAVQRGEPHRAVRLAVTAEAAGELADLPARACEELLARAQLDVPATARLRELAPSAVQPDGRVWLQLVRASDDADLHRVLEAVGERSGAPALLLAGFHLRGSPVVRTEAEAVDAFRRSALDALVVGERLYVRD